jgi:CrcB protein
LIAQGLFQILSGFVHLLVTIGMGFAACAFGDFVARLWRSLSELSEQAAKISVTRPDQGILNIKPEICGHNLRAGVNEYLVIVAGTVLWALFILLAVTVATARDVWIAASFGPVGTLLRWRLAKLNSKIRSFPLGTFIANICGTIVSGGIVIAIARLGPQPSSVTYSVLEGVSNGFCGCLTTLSTFVVELRNLPPKWTVIYFALSIVLSQCLLTLILGTYCWTTQNC